MTPIKAAFLALLLPISLLADVVRPAPSFSWKNIGGTTSTLQKVRGRSTILIIAPNVEDHAFLSQLREIQGVYQFLGANRVLAFVAFTQSPGRVPSNVPYIIVSNGPQVAHLYGAADKFGIALIGRDGNLDDFSNKVVAGQRVLDIINNSFVVQQTLRGGVENPR
jgi:hypothetical protein